MEDRVKVFDFPLECHTAYYFAKCKHDEIYQVRKGTGVPYFIHPKGAALIADRKDLTNNTKRLAMMVFGS